MTKQERFDTLQTAARVADQAKRDLELSLRVRYSYVGYAKPAEQKRLKQLGAASDRAFERFFKFLQSVSPRNWSAGIPAHWTRDRLTYADAVTAGALSVVPPPAYGYTEQSAQQFAQSVQEAA